MLKRKLTSKLPLKVWKAGTELDSRDLEESSQLATFEELGFFFELELLLTLLGRCFFLDKISLRLLVMERLSSFSDPDNVSWCCLKFRRLPELPELLFFRLMTEPEGGLLCLWSMTWLCFMRTGGEGQLCDGDSNCCFLPLLCRERCSNWNVKKIIYVGIKCNVGSVTFDAASKRLFMVIQRIDIWYKKWNKLQEAWRKECYVTWLVSTSASDDDPDSGDEHDDDDDPESESEQSSSLSDSEDDCWSMGSSLGALLSSSVATWGMSTGGPWSHWSVPTMGLTMSVSVEWDTLMASMSRVEVKLELESQLKGAVRNLLSWFWPPPLSWLSDMMRDWNYEGIYYVS